jgi:hypothetical protein
MFMAFSETNTMDSDPATHPLSINLPASMERATRQTAVPDESGVFERCRCLGRGRPVYDAKPLDPFERASFNKGIIPEHLPLLLGKVDIVELLWVRFLLLHFQRTAYGHPFESSP